MPRHVVLAFERAHASQYVDRPGSPQQNAVEDVRLPTVWNQIEAAISYVKDKPLLVLVETLQRDEGSRGSLRLVRPMDSA
jgi:hypothetical protein